MGIAIIIVCILFLLWLTYDYHRKEVEFRDWVDEQEDRLNHGEEE